MQAFPDRGHVEGLKYMREWGVEPGDSCNRGFQMQETFLLHSSGHLGAESSGQGRLVRNQ